MGSNPNLARRGRTVELFERVRERILATGRAARLSATDVDALQRRHSGLPTDYLRFLTEVGYGDLGEIQLHSGPAAATNFYSNPSSDLASVLFEMNLPAVRVATRPILTPDEADDREPFAPTVAASAGRLVELIRRLALQ